MVIAFCLFAGMVSAQVLSPGRINRRSVAAPWLEFDYMEYATSVSASNTYLSSDATATYSATSVVAAMTGESAPTNFVVTASTEYGAGNEAFHVADGNEAASWACANGTTTGWVRVNLGTNNAEVVGKYAIHDRVWGPTFYPAYWKFLGSNETGASTTLDTQSGITWAATETKTFTINNTTAYRYYYLAEMANGGATHLGIYELWLYRREGDGNLVAYSEGTIKSQGSYSLKGVALLTAASNDVLARVLNPASNFTGKTTIKYDVYAGITGRQFDVSIADSGGKAATNQPDILLANTWETKTWDISAVADADKDAVTSLIFRVVSTNQTATNTFYIDNVKYQ